MAVRKRHATPLRPAHYLLGFLRRDGPSLYGKRLWRPDAAGGTTDHEAGRPVVVPQRSWKNQGTHTHPRDYPVLAPCRCIPPRTGTVAFTAATHPDRSTPASVRTDSSGRRQSLVRHVLFVSLRHTGL